MIVELLSNVLWVCEGIVIGVVIGRYFWVYWDTRKRIVNKDRRKKNEFEM